MVYVLYAGNLRCHHSYVLVDALSCERWGRHIIVVRNLGRIMQAVPNTGDNMKHVRKIVRCASAHSYALRNQLRKIPGPNEERDSYLDPEDVAAMDSPNPADQVLIIASRALNRLSGRRVGASRNIHPESLREYCVAADQSTASGAKGDTEIPLSGKAIESAGADREEPEVPLDPIILTQAHTHLSEMGTVQGACERISNCYIPLPYTLLIHRTVWLFLLLSAFALVNDCGYSTPFVNAIIAYVFFGLHEVSGVAASLVAVIVSYCHCPFTLM
jgi:predicted membrane chloride channel (bestrophin family)